MSSAAFVIAIILYMAVNFITAKRWNAREMKCDFIDGQCLVGKILTNIFYLPAWVLKGVRFAVLVLIK